MLILSPIIGLAILYSARRRKGPVWAMALMWLVCIIPVTIGAITYQFVDTDRWLLDIVVSSSMLSVAGGAFVEHLYRGKAGYLVAIEKNAPDDFDRMRRIGRFLWIVGMAGGAFLVMDFIVSGGGSLMNLAELRDSFVMRDSASAFGRVGSLLTWACLFCYLFALLYRDRMRAFETVFFMLPIGAFLLGAILSAGRQAAFQVLMVTIIGQVLYRIRGGNPRSGRALLLSVSGLMVSYMGFVAVARNDNRISDVKAEVLARLFNFRTAEWFDTLLGLFGSGVRNTIVEAVVYFTSSAALFDRFLDTRLMGVSYGAMNFPFLYRQITPLTGIDVAEMYQTKVAMLDAQNVIGVGWTTTVSHLIMDFGYSGTAILLGVQGYIGAWAWRRALTNGDFIDCMMAMLMTIAAIYLPLLPAFSDTNLFLMLVFCVVWRVFGPRPGGSPAADRGVPMADAS